MLKNIFNLFLISCVFATIHCILLLLLHSDTTAMISYVFVGLASWRFGIISGIALTVFNYIWVAITIHNITPEFTGAIKPEAFFAFSINIGIALLLGYFGKLSADLRKEIEMRKKAEASFKQLQNELEERVETRTRELERVKEQLQQAEKLETIGLLVGNIAHDFNNLLNIIIGYSALLTVKLDKKSPEHEYASLIEQTTQTASSLTSNLLKFARKKKYTAQPVNLNELIKEVTPLLKVAVQRGIEIRHIADERIPMILGGADQIKSALLNLSINARDAMKNGGTLSITTNSVDVTHEYRKIHCVECDNGKYAGISVSDTGSGMEPDVARHLFEPFFTTKEEGKGTGLGVTAVLGIVQNHKGAVFVDTKPGQGTTFTLLFPAISEESEPLQNQTAVC